MVSLKKDSKENMMESKGDTCKKHGCEIPTTIIGKGTPYKAVFHLACPMCCEEDRAAEEYQNKINIEKIKDTYRLIIAKGEHFGIPKRFSLADITDFTYDYFYSFDESVLISGACGTGKTHLAVALAKKALYSQVDMIIEKGIAGREYVGGAFPYLPGKCFYNFQTIAIDIKSSFGTDKTTMAELLSPTTKGFAIIDDTGTAKPTDVIIETLYHIVNKRYEDMLPTIYTSNLSLAEMSNVYGDRIASRLSSCRQIKLVCADRRIQK